MLPSQNLQLSLPEGCAEHCRGSHRPSCAGWTEKGQCSHGAGRATSWGGGNPILPSPLSSQASPGTTPGTPAGIRVPLNAGGCPPQKASCPPGAAHRVVTFVPTQGHLPARGSPLAPASIRVPGQAAQRFSAPLPLKSGQHRGETGEEVSDSTRRLRLLRPRGGARSRVLRALPGTHGCCSPQAHLSQRGQALTMACCQSRCWPSSEGRTRGS